MNFLRRVAGLSCQERVRSSAIWGELKVEPLLHCAESQMKLFGHLVGRLPDEVFGAHR